MLTKCFLEEVLDEEDEFLYGGGEVTIEKVIEKKKESTTIKHPRQTLCILSRESGRMEV